MVARVIKRPVCVDDIQGAGQRVLARSARKAAVALTILTVLTVHAAEPAKEHDATHGRPTSAVVRPATATPLAVLGFDAQRWAAMLREPGPALVVFTSTDCAHCPQAIDRLVRHQRDERRAGRPVPRLDVVVMDGRDEPEAMLSDIHYQRADRLFAFEGQAARVRHGVNPAWFGQTPYIALLGRASPDGQATVRFVSGTPSDRDLGELR